MSVGGNLTIAFLNEEQEPSNSSQVAGGALPGFSHDDCVPIVGNRLAALVRYRRGPPVNTTPDLSPVALRPVIIEVRLRPPARLYAWRFECV